jgi:hypothetical protein
MSCWNYAIKFCSLWVKFSTNRLVAWDMNNCKTNIFSKPQDYSWNNTAQSYRKNKFKKTVCLVTQHTIAPRCHCQGWRNNALSGWRNVIQSDCFKILQEVLDGFPVMLWKQNHQIQNQGEKAETVLYCHTSSDQVLAR